MGTNIGFVLFLVVGEGQAVRWSSGRWGFGVEDVDEFSNGSAEK